MLRNLDGFFRIQAFWLAVVGVVVFVLGLIKGQPVVGVVLALLVSGIEVALFRWDRAKGRGEPGS